MACGDDLVTLENFTYGDTPTLGAIKRLLTTINTDTTVNNSGTGRWETMMQPLSNQTDIRPLPLKTLLVHLEMAGRITPLYSYYAEYRFKPESESALLFHFNGERQEFIQTLLNHSKKGRTWYSLDMDALIQNLGPDARSRAVKALEYCAEQQWLTLEIKQMTEVYEVKPWQVSETDAIADELHQSFMAHQNSDIQRLHNMVSLFQSQQCLSRQLAVYFNDHSMTQDCGHCSVCMGKWQPWPQNSVAQAPDSAQIQGLLTQFNQAWQATFKQMPEPETQTRFLSGMTSPWLTKVKARKVANYAALEQVPYAATLNTLQS